MSFWTGVMAAAVAASISAAPPAEGPTFNGTQRGAAPIQAKGYVEAEYVVSGQVDGKPYRTTLFVRRPADPAKFSGLVVVEPVHVGGYSVLAQFWDVLEAGGHGYALVGAQRAPLEMTIKRLNPARYGSMVLPEGPKADLSVLSGALANAPPDLAPLLASSVTEAPIAHEVLSQTGALIKANKADGPFPGLKVLWLVTGGYSQTGGLTLTYLQGGAADRAAVFDGFLPLAATGEVPVPPHRGKVIQALGEADFSNYLERKAAHRRPDSDRAGDQYRLYEIGAAPHISTRGQPKPEQIYGPAEEPSAFPSRMLYAKAMQNLIDWVVKGRPPPKAERFKLDATGSIARDAYGNALGGVRSSYLDIPIARYETPAPPGPNGFNRQFYGVQHRLPPETLKSLYPTHEAYVAKVQVYMLQMVANRWIGPGHALELIEEAKAAKVP